MRLLQLIFLIENVQGGPPSDIKWDISHCVDEVISPGVGEEQHSKVIVSRYYPSPMGNNWQCEYKIQNPDTQMKIMVEFLFFDMARCDLQNITIVDWKTKNAVGPLCGTDTPQRYLSESSRIHIFVKSGQIPEGVRHIGFMLKVTRTPPGFEEEFQRLLRQESGEPEYPDYMAGLGRPLGRLQNAPGMRMPGMGGRPMPGMFPGLGMMNMMNPGMIRQNMGQNQMGMGFRPQQPSKSKLMPTASRSPGYSDGPPHLSAAYGPERASMNAPTSFSNAAVDAISRRNQGGMDQAESPMQLQNGISNRKNTPNGPPLNRINMRNQQLATRNSQQNGQRLRAGGRQQGFNNQRKQQAQPTRGMLIPPPIRMKSNNQKPKPEIPDFALPPTKATRTEPVEEGLSSEIIISLVCVGIVLVSIIAVAITCKLRSVERKKKEEYKTREKVTAARNFEKSKKTNKFKN